MRSCFIRLSLLAISFLVSLPLKSQTIQEWIIERPLRACANTNPYEFEETYDTPAPKGYKPFYISHYGRHGARSNWKDGEYINIIRTLEAAKSEGNLTAAGDSVLVATKQVLKEYNGMDGRLTARGVKEQQMLAERMFQRYHAIFTQKSHGIRAVSSSIPRCLVSMAAFTSRLASLLPYYSMSFDSGEQLQKYLLNDCPKDIYASSSSLLDSLLKTGPPDTLSVLSYLFNDTKRGSELIADKDRFQKHLFNTAKITGSFDIGTNIFGALPQDVIMYWSRYYNAELYLRHCNSVEYGDSVLPVSAPLLKDIMDKAADAIENRGIAADLRFGHDYPVMTLGAVIGLEGIGDRMTYKEVGTKWHGAAYTPFSANIQIVFYKNYANDILVKFLLNEKETMLIDKAPLVGPYYRWEEIKHDWERKMESFAV